MKKITLILAIFFVVLFSQITFAKQDSKTAKFSEKSTVEPDPLHSVTVQINGTWYIITFDNNGYPIEIIQAPIKN
jgi:hypothetical protein